MDLGSSAYWIRELASGRLTQEQLNPMMVTRFLIALAVAGVVVVVAAFTEPRFIATGVILLSSTIVVMALVPLRAARRADLVGLLTALDRAVSIVAFFGLSLLGVRMEFALWISIALGDLSLAIFVGISQRSQLRLSSLALGNPWAGAKWYSLTALSASAQSLDLPILTALAGASAAGIYGGVNRWTQPMILATSSFAAAVAPFLAGESDLRVLRAPILRASRILAIAIFLGVGVIVAAPWLVVFLLGDAYASSAAVLRWLGGSVIVNAISLPLLVALSSRQFDHLAAVILFFSVGVQLAVVALLAPTVGALSAGIGIFASQSLQLVASVSVTAAIVWRRRRRSREQI